MPPKHHNKPHPKKRKGGKGRLWASVIVGFGLTVFVAAVMSWFAVPLNVVLPTCAPILVGSITLAYTVQSD